VCLQHCSFGSAEEVHCFLKLHSSDLTLYCRLEDPSEALQAEWGEKSSKSVVTAAQPHTIWPRQCTRVQSKLMINEISNVPAEKGPSLG